MCRVFHFAVVFLVMTVCSCDKPVTVFDDHSAGDTKSNEKLGEQNPSLSLASNRGDESPVSVLSRVKSFSEVEMPPAKFEAGRADPIEPTELVVESTDYGYVVAFPSGSPIPTPTIIGSRVYVSGGFSSESFHCLDLASGKPIWEVRLDDDGPSTGVPCDDLILLGTESCTVFALHQETGELAWSAYLGDPLLSTPAVANGRMVTVYPATSEPPEVVTKLSASPQMELKSSMTEKAQSQESGAVDDADPRELATRIADLLEPTHLAICMDTKSGEVRWRTWVDSDCLSTPVIVGPDVYIASLSGTLYQLSMEDGSVRSAHRAKATSAPLVIEDSIYITRRHEKTDGTPQEYLSFLRREDSNQYFASARMDAVYLRAAVQMKSELQDAAADFEQMNGFGGGGFGGGFGGNQGGIGGSGGSFQIPDDILDTADRDEQPNETAEGESHHSGQGIDYSMIDDLLGYTEVQAAENIGLGSASTIQGFAGSTTVGDSSRLYNTLGDRLVCTSRRTGDVIWTLQINGDLERLGGHLASPPVLQGNRLFLATAQGKVVKVNPEIGRAIEIKQLDAQFRFRPVVTPNVVIVTSQDGQLFCLNR